jgi:hypothetical protein
MWKIFAGIGAVIAAAILIIGSFSIVTMKSEISSIKLQESRAQFQESQIRLKLIGERRDVITCQDIQNLGIESYWQNGYGELQGTAVSLPGHCINP